MLTSTLPATVDLKAAVDPDCGLIMAEPTKIYQVVMNLCTNAFQSLKDERGSIRVTLSQHPQAHNGKAILLTIVDSGQGIEPEILPHIFDPYFSTKAPDNSKGTGLGLAVVHGIVQGYDGTIEVESAPGQGTTFRVMIPSVTMDQPPATQAPKPLAEDLLYGSEQVLLLDDEPMLVEMNKMLLSDFGYAVTGLTDSREALQRVQDHPGQFDLIVTDQTLPGMTGVEFAQKVLAANPDLPIILCTGYSNVVSKDEALSLGIRRYLRKPVQDNELVEAVRTVLDERRS